MALHADQHGASRMAGQALLRAKEAGLLTDANVVAATNVASLQTNITAASTHADQQPIKARLNRMLDIAFADDTLANTPLQAATTVSGAAGLTQADIRRTAGGPVE
jgi:hypothetical protein